MGHMDQHHITPPKPPTPWGSPGKCPANADRWSMKSEQKKGLLMIGCVKGWRESMLWLRIIQGRFLFFSCFVSTTSLKPNFAVCGWMEVMFFCFFGVVQEMWSHSSLANRWHTSTSQMLTFACWEVIAAAWLEGDISRILLWREEHRTNLWNGMKWIRFVGWISEKQQPTMLTNTCNGKCYEIVSCECWMGISHSTAAGNVAAESNVQPPEFAGV